MRAALLAGSLLLVAGCETAPPGRTLVLVTIDTLRADHLGAYGYPRGTSPALDRFAASSVVFLDCRSVSSWTMPAIGTIATGLRPNHHGMVYWHMPLAEGTETVAEVLGDAGVASAFFGNLIPRMEGIERGFHRWETFEGDDDAVVDAAVRWTRSERGGDRFLWVHLLSPHAPYDPRPGTNRPEAGFDPRTLAYDGEIRTVDTLVARLLAALDADDAVLITADHGEMLDEREELNYGHGNFLYEELVRLPLAARFPGRAPRLEEGTVLLADIPVTICRWFGEEPPSGSYGVSLLPVIAGRRPVPRDTTFAFITEDDPPKRRDRRWSVRTGDLKAVFNLDEKDVRLFDLVTDPQEIRDVSAEHPEAIAADRRALDAWRAASPTPTIPYWRQFSREEIRRLQSLGYLRGAR